MKKHVYVLLVGIALAFLGPPDVGAQINFYGRTAPTGGAAGALDALDGDGYDDGDGDYADPGEYPALADGDGAYIIIASTFDRCDYVLDADASCGGDSAESPCPIDVQPDANPGTKCWRLLKVNGEEVNPITPMTHEEGGLEADVSAYSGIPGISGGATSEVDTEAELESMMGGLNLLVNTELNTFAEAQAMVADKTLMNDEDDIGVSVQAYSANLDTYAGIAPSANAQSFLGAADYAAMRILLALVIGTNVQAWDAQLDTWATVTPSANGQSLVAAANYAAMRTLLSLVPGTDVQAYNANLTTWAGIAPSANVQSLNGAANYAAIRALLDLEAGTDFYSIAGADAAFQPLDADLTTWGSITPSANVQSFVSAANYAAMKALLSIDDLVTLSGVADGAVNLGTFTGSTIDDNLTIKAALQDLETFVEGLGGGHDALTLAADADTVFGLSTQELNLDTQTANYVFAGPTGGGAADPTFRALVAADIPDISATYELQLANEAGLYAVLSDVIDFVQTAEIDSAAELETVASLGAFFNEYADDATAAAMLVTLGLSATASEINTPLDGASVTLTEFQELETIGATTISANQWVVLGGIAETLTSGELNILDGVTGVTAAELSYIGDVTSAIQAQLDLKAPLASPTFTGIVTLPIAAAPTTDADGEMSFDTDGWGAGYDALEIWNGTASAYVVATTAADTPTNGQVPKWNTGGTITWEADNDSAGTPTAITVADSTDTTSFPAFFETATGDLGPKTDASNLTYNATSGALSSTSFTDGTSVISGGTIELGHASDTTLARAAAGVMTVEDAYVVPSAVTIVPIGGDINTYITAATAGDTLILSAGTYTITAAINVSKQLNIRGQGNAGLYSVGVTDVHGTRIYCATDNVAMFNVTASNVRLADMSLYHAGAGAGIGAVGVVTANNLNGLSFNNLDVVMPSGAGKKWAIDILGSDAILRGISFYMISTNATAYGVYAHNDSSTTQNAIIDVHTTSGTVDAGSTRACPYYVYNDNDANTITVNLFASWGEALTGTANDVAAFVDSATTNNAILNIYESSLKGADYAVEQSGTNVVTVFGGTMFDGLTTGTIHYAGTVGAKSVVLEGTTANAFEGTLTAAEITTPDKTWTLPDFTGTVAVATPSATATHALFATAVSGAPAYRAIADGDVADDITVTSTKALSATTGTFTGALTGTSLAISGPITGTGSWGSNITGNISLNTTDLHGKMYQVTAACTITLDAAADAGYGASVYFWVRDALETATIEVDASDKINLHGTPLDAGDTIDSPGNAGDLIVLIATTDADGSGTDGWITGGYAEEVWTDGGAT
jgi:hypothetical protein